MSGEKSEKIQRPLSAWIIYCNENRATIKDLNPSFGFTETARALSEGFKSLTEEDKAIYDLKASDDKERYNQEMKEYQLRHPPGTELAQRSQSSLSLPREIIFPLARIKKTMKLDSQVRNIQKEALVVVSKAMELFVGYLGTRSSQVAIRNKRKTIKESDLIEVIHGVDCLHFLHSDFPKLLVQKSKPTRSNPVIVEDRENSTADQQEVQKSTTPTTTATTTTTTTNNQSSSGTINKFFSPKIDFDSDLFENN